MRPGMPASPHLDRIQRCGDIYTFDPEDWTDNKTLQP